MVIRQLFHALKRIWGGSGTPGNWHAFICQIPAPIKIEAGSDKPSLATDTAALAADDIDVGGLLSRLEDRLLKYRRIAVAPLYFKALVEAVDADIGDIGFQAKSIVVRATGAATTTNKSVVTSGAACGAVVYSDAATKAVLLVFDIKKH